MPLHDRPTWLLSRAHGRAHTLLYDAFVSAGSRPYYYRLLEALARLGQLSQADLGRAAQLDRSDVTESLTELLSRGLVDRERDPDDRRQNLISLSSAGITELARLESLLDDVQSQLLAPLTPAQRAEFLTLLQRLDPGSS